MFSITFAESLKLVINYFPTYSILTSVICYVKKKNFMSWNISYKVVSCNTLLPATGLKSDRHSLAGNSDFGDFGCKCAATEQRYFVITDVVQH